jgi:hypothetical protein
VHKLALATLLVTVLSNAAQAEAPPRLDLLFVVGNSASMGEEQEALAASLPVLLDGIAAAAGARPDLHIGVISTDVGIGGDAAGACRGAGDDGALQATPRLAGCAPPDDAYIADAILADGRHQVNYPGGLDETFACIARLGTDGCGFEQPLLAVLRSLFATAGTGFHRDDAMLAVIIVSDQDDCSASGFGVFDPASATAGPFDTFRCAEYGVTCDGDPIGRAGATYQDCAPRTDSYLIDPAEYARMLVGFKARVFVAAVTGPAAPFTVTVDEGGAPGLAPSCASSALGAAVPGVRLRAFAAAFPAHAAASICQEDLGLVLGEIGAQIGAALVGPFPEAPPAEPEASGCAIARSRAGGAGALLAALAVASLARRRRGRPSSPAPR